MMHQIGLERAGARKPAKRTARSVEVITRRLPQIDAEIDRRARARLRGAVQFALDWPSLQSAAALQGWPPEWVAAEIVSSGWRGVRRPASPMTTIGNAWRGHTADGAGTWTSSLAVVAVAILSLCMTRNTSLLRALWWGREG